MEKKNSVEEIIDLLEFTGQEKEVFKASIQLIKSGQTDESINAQQDIYNLIKELVKNEVS